VPVGFRPVRNALAALAVVPLLPKTGWKAFGVVGKSAEVVFPVTQALPLASTAMPPPSRVIVVLPCPSVSSQRTVPEPPRYVE
jgi:hypothetical protein